MVKIATQVSTSGDMDTQRRAGSGERRQWSEALKRQIVAEAQDPGASMSIVARRHEVNANQASSGAERWWVSESVTMLPVEIAREPGERCRARRTGIIEIAFAYGTRVCLRGEVSAETLRQLLR
jgi:transposase